MRLNLGKSSRRTLLAGIMLVALASRVLIPPGFMPASDRPFWIEICWDGLPAGMLAQLKPAHAESTGMESMHMESMGMDGMPANSMGPHHHHGSRSQSEHCVFGSACSAGPIPHLPPPSDLLPAQPIRAVALASIVLIVRVVHLPQPRAPPARLI
jgi:peptidoglycan/LPS O-acetylase OafA/YrhL